MTRSRHLDDGEDRLIFAWKDRYHRKLRLAFFLIIALALHVFCFYLFQVEYPKAERRLPYTAQLTVLNPRDTLTQVALRQIDDRTVSIDSAAREALKDAQIEDFATVFKPFFQDYEARLKEPPPIYQVTPVSDLVEAGTAVLPSGPVPVRSDGGRNRKSTLYTPPASDHPRCRTGEARSSPRHRLERPSAVFRNEQRLQRCQLHDRGRCRRTRPPLSLDRRGGKRDPLDAPSESQCTAIPALLDSRFAMGMGRSKVVIRPILILIPCFTSLSASFSSAT